MNAFQYHRLAKNAAGCQLMTWFAMACELRRDWRNDDEGLRTLFSNHLPNYRCLICSHLSHTQK